MFAPGGYLPLSTLRNALEVEEEAIEKWLTELISASSDVQKPWDTEFFDRNAWLAKTYTLYEVFRLAFSDILEKKSVHVCHPDRGVWNFEFPVLQNLISYRHLAVQIDQHGDFFDIGVDWLSHRDQVEKLVEEGEDPFLSLFVGGGPMSPHLFFNPESFIIDLTELRLLQDNSDYAFMVASLGYPFEARELVPFEGWALVVPKREVNFGELALDFRESCGKIMVGALFGQQYVDNYQREHPEQWQAFLGFSSSQMGSPRSGTVAAETEAFKYLVRYFEDSGTNATKTELKAELPFEIGERAFERVWDRLREKFPEISRPGRRKKP